MTNSDGVEFNVFRSYAVRYLAYVSRWVADEFPTPIRIGVRLKIRALANKLTVKPRSNKLLPLVKDIIY